MVLLLTGAAIIWYMFTLKFEDTTITKADFSVQAVDFIKEFEQNDSLANLKYIEKIITVTGTVTEIEGADSSKTIRMTDTVSGNYVIFAFQPEVNTQLLKVKEGEQLSVKGSCSGSVFSKILEVRYISFKRCVIN